MTVHAQENFRDDIISSCLHRNNPAHEITKNTVIIEFDTNWKTTALLAGTVYCLPPPCSLIFLKLLTGHE